MSERNAVASSAWRRSRRRAWVLVKRVVYVAVALVVGAATQVLSSPAAHAATPPTPAFPAAIDGYYPVNDETADCSDNAAKPGVVDFKNLVLAANPGSADWGISSGHCDDGQPSGHKQGRAWDFHPSSKAVGDSVVNWLLAADSRGNANALLRRFGISYIVWYNRIWEAYPGFKYWHEYNNCEHGVGDDTACHRNHVHLSFGWAGAWKQTTWWTAQPTSTTTFLPPQITVLENNTANCPGTSQYFNANDDWGTPIHWTYANGSHACVRVAFAPRTTSTTCRFAFYVPIRYATADAIFGFWTTDGVKHYATVHETNFNGWTTAFSSANVTAINFQDNDGQGYPLQIGWGAGSAYGLRQIC